MSRVNSDICYYCGVTLDRANKTKEHVPPKCFFPNGKNNNLITVPSCEKHNSQKSNDDEYLFQMIATNIRAKFDNQDFKNKAYRGIQRNLKNLSQQMFQKSNILNAELTDNRLIVKLGHKYDDDRINRCIEHIAKGLYFHEFETPYNLELSVVYTTRTAYEPHMLYLNDSITNIQSQISSIFSNIEKKGNNQEIFYYQFIEIDDDILFNLCFYQGINFLISSSQITRFFNINN